MKTACIVAALTLMINAACSIGHRSACTEPFKKLK